MTNSLINHYFEKDAFEHSLQSLANVLNVFPEAQDVALLSSSISIGSGFLNDFVLLNASKVFSAPIVNALDVPKMQFNHYYLKQAHVE